MQSYAAARGHFSFLEMISWGIIIFGGLLALGGMLSLGKLMSDYGASPLAGLSGLVPGFMVMFAGFMGLVQAQIGRAGVDSAEYGQQSLALSRRQLEISEQSLRQERKYQEGFAALNANKAASPEASEPRPAASFADAPASADSAQLRQVNASEIEYNGKTIRIEDGKYCVAQLRFAELSAAQRYVDQLGLNEHAQLGSNAAPETRSDPAPTETPARQKIIYRDQVIYQENGKLTYRFKTFRSLDAVEKYIDEELGVDTAHLTASP